MASDNRKFVLKMLKTEEALLIALNRRSEVMRTGQEALHFTSLTIHNDHFAPQYMFALLQSALGLL